MIGLTVILLGLIAAYTGFTGRGTAMIDALREDNAKYTDIKMLPYGAAVIVSSLPLLAIKNEKQANAYMILMLVSLAVYHYKAIDRFSGYIRGIGQ